MPADRAPSWYASYCGTSVVAFLKPPHILRPRSPARRADCSLVEAVQIDGEDCKNVGVIRSSSKEKWAPLWETTGLATAACNTSSTSACISAAFGGVIPVSASSGGMPLTTPISSRPLVRWSSMANSSATRHGVL